MLKPKNLPVKHVIAGFPDFLRCTIALRVASARRATPTALPYIVRTWDFEKKDSIFAHLYLTKSLSGMYNDSFILKRPNLNILLVKIARKIKAWPEGGLAGRVGPQNFLRFLFDLGSNRLALIPNYWIIFWFSEPPYCGVASFVYV